MRELALFENEALHHALVDAAAKIDLKLDERSIEEALPDNLIILLTEQIVQVLEDPSFRDIVERIPNQPRPNQAEGYGLRLWARYKTSHPNSMTFYRIKDSWHSSCLSLAGLAIALATSATLGTIIPAAKLVLTTWKNLVTLRRPDDAIQIDTYEALVQAQAALLRTETSRKNPNAGDIYRSAKFGSTLESVEHVQNGLARLRERGLVEVSKWGEDSEDYQHPENTWRPRL